MTDNTGHQTLEVIAKANKFNSWMYETIRPYCHGSVLEIGSGIGNISQFFIRDGYFITLSDPNEVYLDQLKKKYTGINILSMDLVCGNFNKDHNNLFQVFDTVVFLNVLEHIHNDELAVENCSYFLKPGGSLVVLVPAYSFLYSRIDKELGHYRRYTAKKLGALISKKNFSVKKVFYFNALGIVAWMFGKVFGFRLIPPENMKLFNRLVPFAKFIDKIFFRKIGLSVILIAQKDL